MDAKKISEVESLMMTIINAGGEAGGAGMKAAEAELKIRLKPRASGMILIHLLEHSENEGCRQMAGVLLRPKLVPTFNRLDSASQTAIKTMLLNRLAAEPSRNVRKSIIMCIATLCKALLPGGGWPEVLVLFQQAITHPAEEVRELSMLLLLELAESLGTRIAKFSEGFKPAVMSCLGDASSKVRLAALRAVGALLVVLEKKKYQRMYSDVLGPLMGALQHALGLHSSEEVADDEETATAILDVIDDLVRARSPIVTSPGTEVALFTAMITVMRAKYLELSTRAAAAMVLQTMLRRGKWLVANNLLEPLFPVLMDLAAEWDAEEAVRESQLAIEAGIDEDEDAEETVSALACRCFDILARSVPPRVFLPLLSQYTLQAAQSGEWLYRRAALVVLGVSAEGASRHMQDAIEQVMEIPLRLSEDPHEHVRAAACFALAFFSEHLQPRISRYHARIFPAVLRVLSDANASVVMRGLWVIETFSDLLPRATMVEYLQPVMDTLSALLTRPGLPVSVQCNVIACISNIALVTESSFLPYFASVAGALSSLLTRTDDEGAVLKARAMSCLGMIAVAVGFENFGPYFQPCIAAAVGCFQGEHDFDIAQREAAFEMLSAFAQVAGEHPDFVALVPTLLPLCMDTIRTSEGISVSRTTLGEGDGGMSSALSGVLAEDEAVEEEEEDDEDADPDGQRLNLQVHSSFIELKASAVLCLCRVMAHCPPNVLVPFLSDAVDVIEMMISFFAPEVRNQALSGLQLLIKGLARQAPPTSAGLGAVPEIPEIWRDTYNTFMTVTLSQIQYDEDPEVVGICLNNISSWCETLGVAAVTSHLSAIVKAILTVLTGKAQFQQDFDGEDEYEDVDDDDEEEGEEGHGDDHAGDQNDAGTDADAPGSTTLLRDDVGDQAHINVLDESIDTLTAVAKVSQRAFVEHLPSVLQALRTYMTPGAGPAFDRQISIGAAADLSHALGPEFNSVAEFVLQTLLPVATDPSKEVQRNWIYCVGLVASHGASVPGIQALIPSILDILLRFVNTPRTCDESNAVVDNALSAVCRIWKAIGPTFPADTVIPALANALPIRFDWSEQGSLQQCFIPLLLNRHPAVWALLPKVLNALAVALVPANAMQLKAADLAELQNGLKSLVAMVRASPDLQGSWETAVASLASEVQFALTSSLA